MQKTKRIVKRIYISLQWSFHTCEDEPVVREKKLLSSVLFPVRPSLSSLFYSPHITRLLTTSNSSLLSSYCFFTLSCHTLSFSPQHQPSSTSSTHLSLYPVDCVCVWLRCSVCLYLHWPRPHYLTTLQQLVALLIPHSSPLLPSLQSEVDRDRGETGEGKRAAQKKKKDGRWEQHNSDWLIFFFY